MAKKIMVQGTCSNAGKSLIAAGLCRVFAKDGYKVAPFKAQNMALNSFITREGLEMGRAQVTQAEAAGIEPDVRMNPILLKPNSDKGSQIILNGDVYGNATAVEYYKKKDFFKREAKKAFDDLSRDYDIIVMEGAGSPAEINLKNEDLVNMGMAKLVDAPVIITGDIDRGGVFASLAGTMLLFDEEERNLVKGVLINKFRGDLSILEPGLDMLRDIIKVPVLGVMPYIDVDIDDEDSISCRKSYKNGESIIDIAVMKTPRISNFTDFNALTCIEGVSLRYVYRAIDFGNPDMVIIPGTKNTMGDLKWLRQSGLEAKIMQHAHGNKPIFGICGGYQMLGQKLSDPLNIEHGGEMNGMGLLPHSTLFEAEKIRKAETGILSDVTGIFEDLSGIKYKGYEIHMGTSKGYGNIINRGNVYGTYIHGIFDVDSVAKVVIGRLMEEKGYESSNIKTFNMDEYKQNQYDILESSIRQSLDIDYIYSILR